MSNLLEGLAPWPQIDFSEFGKVEVKRLSRIQKLVGSFLGRNWVAVPHVTHHDDADITEMEASRAAFNRSSGVKITPVALLVRALALSLVEYPVFNASLDPASDTLVMKKYVHIGVAVDTPNGLLVPVIRDCNTKTLIEIAQEISILSERARTKGLSMSEMSGGCITLTSLGHIGGTGFTPIVNAPEVAILGVTRARPVPTPAADGQITWRQMLPLSLSYDHRVINGADAARFVRFLSHCLGDATLFD
jgi:pyruvate dehydrogenase E2 component (dihydrolipoamide acetyltransferase)